MSKTIVISQSMYFPWVGFLEQIRLADVFVHYDDVQFSKGSFTNRVQIKTSAGMRWLTVPLSRRKLEQNIDEIVVDDRTDWRRKQRDFLKQSFRNAPFASDALALIETVFASSDVILSDVSRKSLMALVCYFDLEKKCSFVDSKELGIGNSSCQRVLDIVKTLNGDKYITGHGAMNYLDHRLFERAGVEVRYMQYEITPYPQPYGPFTPYVSGLDLVANCGKDGLQVAKSKTMHWRKFIDG